MIVNFTGAWDVRNITKAVKDTDGRFVFATKCKDGQWAFYSSLPHTGHDVFIRNLKTGVNSSPVTTYKHGREVSKGIYGTLMKFIQS